MAEVSVSKSKPAPALAEASPDPGADSTVERIDACENFTGWRVPAGSCGEGSLDQVQIKGGNPMNKRIKCEMEAMDRVDLFGKRTDITLTPKLTGLFTTVGLTLTTLRNWGTEQVSGGHVQSAGVLERRVLAHDIRDILRDIAEIGKSMEEEGQVGTSELFRYPRYSTYESLLLTAESFADRADTMTAAFTDRGLPATFVADLRAKLTAFRTATSTKYDGRADQTAGTAGLKATAAIGMKAVRTLRPLMRVLLKSDPALLTAWNLAARVERPPRPATIEQPPVENPPEESGS